MANDISILIKSLIDQSSLTKSKTEIENVIKKLNGNTIDLKINILNKSELEDITNVFKDIQIKLNSFNLSQFNTNVASATTKAKQEFESMNKVLKESSKTSYNKDGSINSIVNTTKEQLGLQQKITKETNDLRKISTEIVTDYQKIENEQRKQIQLEEKLKSYKIQQTQNVGNYQYKNADVLDENDIRRINEYKQALNSLNAEDFQNKSSIDSLNRQYTAMENIVALKKQTMAENEGAVITENKVAESIAREAQQQENLNRKIKDFQTAQKVETSRITGKYTGLYNKADIESYYNELKKLSTINPNEAVKKFESLRTELKRIEVNAKNSGNAIKSTMQDAISPTQALLNNLSKFGVKILLLYSNV